MKKVIEDEKSAIEYVRNVLAEWSEWKTHHSSLVQALEILVNRDNVKSNNIKKQIDDICADVTEAVRANSHKCEEDYYIVTNPVNIAQNLYYKNYRKAEDVAREIFEEIERETKNHGITYVQRKIAELKKKYESEKGNG